MKLFKIVCGYIAAGALGIGMYLCARPYALAHRTDPSLYGGEVLLIFIPLIIRLLRRAARY